MKPKWIKITAFLLAAVLCTGPVMTAKAAEQGEPPISSESATETESAAEESVTREEPVIEEGTTEKPSDEEPEIEETSGEPATEKPEKPLPKRPAGTNRGYIRAKIEYEYDEGVTGLSDNIVDFAGGWTKKQDGWYYYGKPVMPGDKVRFISCVHVPRDWTNEMSDKHFKVIVTAEASEAAPEDMGWHANTEILYSETFDVWSLGYEHDDSITIQEGKLTITIREYQLDSKGNEVPYENDKIIVPGQPISKIVEFEIGGTLGGNIGPEPEIPEIPEPIIPPVPPETPKPQEKPKPPKKLDPEPVKYTLERPVKTAESGGMNIDGADVEQGTVITYHIKVRNPMPDDCVITVTDPVDYRLTAIDTGGGVFIEQPDNGMGGTLQWEVELSGYQEGTVSFTARVGDIANDTVIPNIAEAMMDGQYGYGGTGNAVISNSPVKSNAPIVGVGSPSIIEKVIARATYDPAYFLPAVVLALLSAAGITAAAIVLKRRSNKKAEGLK